ncbi:hypothetical protein GCM10008023_05580 [Sphingomonas glacialis]|uniref:Uncharacterized protein n=1 Tax=Sphingomonas glacialis TaxID=658225 RepID=A0ABQ3L934_9SPHN|nr:hypothetical protein [Sphingomonas glacialis]GHH09215.1 hypothetical protein GCM10008023_05580 [Sphingomonas glacialis]
MYASYKQSTAYQRSQKPIYPLSFSGKAHLAVVPQTDAPSRLGREGRS